MRLLIVEDERKTASYLHKGLRESGFIVDVATQGEDGLHLALNGDYDLVILDVMLPERDGWSILAAMRRAGRATPVLFLTARDAVADRVKGLELGADDYLVKPFAFSELLARVRSVLRRGPGRRLFAETTTQPPPMKTRCFFRRLTAAPALPAWAALLAVTLPAAAAPYAGTEACRQCHLTKYNQLQSSIHSQMIRKLTDDGTLPATQPSMVARLSHLHGDLRAENAPPLADVTYAMGGWYKEESYIKEGVDPATGKATFTVTRYEWDPIKGHYRDDRDGTRNWLTKCAGCHTTGYDPATQTFAEVNIGCEACHGPGGDHVLSAGEVPMIIDRSSEGCGYCHIRAENAATAEFPAQTFNFPIGYQLGQPETLQFIPQPLSDTAASFFPDGTSKRHRQQYLDMRYPGFRVTKHYERNVTCTSCHDPHTAGVVTVHAGIPAGANVPGGDLHGIAIYDNGSGAASFVEWDGEGLKPGVNCRTCHAGVDPKHVHYFTDKALAAPVDCMDCHMPDVINVNPATLRGALHPHTFQAMRPETSLKYGPDLQANSCTCRCHQDTGSTKAERAQWAAGYLQSHLQLISLGATTADLQLTGIRGFTYTLEDSEDLRTWVPLGTGQADANGVLHFQDAAAPRPYRFYRAVEP